MSAYMRRHSIYHINKFKTLLVVCREDGIPTQIKVDIQKCFKPVICFNFSGFGSIPLHPIIVDTLIAKQAIWHHSTTCTNRYKHYLPCHDFIEIVEQILKDNKAETIEIPLAEQY